MEYFEYTVKNHLTGKKSKGIVTSDNIEAAEETLKRRGEDIIEISLMPDLFNIRRKIYNFSTRVNKKTKCEFFSMINWMLESGMSLHESLINIRDTSISKSLRNLAGIAADEVRKGATLSSASRKTNQFDEAVVEQITAGEESGTINNALNRIVAQMEREIEFKSKIKSAMMYPVIICVVMVIVLWVLMTVVVPSLANTLVSMGGELPLITKIVIGVSDFMAASTPFLIVGIILAVIAYRIAVKNHKFRFAIDTYKLKIPVIGPMLERIELSRFCSNLSAMQKSGITLVSSLKIVGAAIKNQKIASNVRKACSSVEISGMNLSTALSYAGDFPPMMLQLIEVGIESGQISEVLDRIALQYEKETDVSLKRVTSLIEPVMIIVTGILAGVVVTSIFVPMFSLVDNLGV